MILLFPANLKIEARILTKRIPMCFDTDEREERILTGCGMATYKIEKTTLAWEKYVTKTISMDVEGRPVKTAVEPLGKPTRYPIRNVIDMKETVHRLDNPVTYRKEDYKTLVREIVKRVLRAGVERAIISKPDQWLVYAENIETLTRVLYTHKIINLREIALLGRQILLVCDRVNHYEPRRENIADLFALQTDLRSIYDTLLLSRLDLETLELERGETAEKEETTTREKVEEEKTEEETGGIKVGDVE